MNPTCHFCEREITNPRPIDYVTNDGHEVCDQCWDEEVDTCIGCGRAYLIENLDVDGYCEDCIEDEEEIDET